ncbi:hypothetical protein BGZ99_007371 [Dissophora globulifera]|uniref:VLRF1 domain-containing protein n=1 Tax=Dissophora globulifera TaxID=979702 RepID=A0A9P6RWA7_9FUNG|nr:hypothetical protein BGZ99_007371 [Dissophora globulifera]
MSQQHSIQQATAASAPTAPLSVFFLPQELISSLVPRTQAEATLSAIDLFPSDNHVSSSSSASPSVSSPVTTSLDSAVASCRICGIASFESVAKQREHVKLDWHRYNLKQNLLDKRAKPISELQFEDMMQDLSSISGSDDSSDDSESNQNRTIIKSNSNAAINDQDKGDNQDDEDEVYSRTLGESLDQEAVIQSLMKKLELTVQENRRARHQDPVLIHRQQILEQQLQEARLSPMIWFTTPLYDETVRLGIYKNALPNKGLTSGDNILDYLQSLQFNVPPVVKKQKNSKIKRAARRAAVSAEAVAASGQADGEDTTLAVDSEAPALASTPVDTETLTTQIAPPATEEAAGEEDDDEEESYEPDWIKYQNQNKRVPALGAGESHQARYWTLIMIGGGHFAGVVMDLAGQVSSHVRRKQGGSQATHGIANSAGARIRMYNEEALKTEVRELLDGWSHWIQQSECVFVHSPGNNRRVLFYDNSILSTADRQGRVRTIPFLTRRPTLSELKRAYQELTTVKVSIVTKEALERQERQEKEALERALEASASQHTKSTKSKDASSSGKGLSSLPEATPELLKLVELVKKGRAEAMSSHLLKYNMDASQLLPLTTSTEYDIRRTPTILHLASHHGQHQVIKTLLEKHSADPTTTTVTAKATSSADGESTSNDDDNGDAALLGSSALTAYDVAKDKETRNAFRRAMALLPDAWDWTVLAHVPSALTPEMEAEQERKAKEKTRKLLEAERERKKSRENSRPTTPSNSGVGGAGAAKSPSAGSSSVMAKNMAAVSAANSQLSPEMRMRLERERRANAAEARMAAQRQAELVRREVREGKNICVACGKSLDGLTPFDKFGRKFCTTDCVAKGPA